VIETGTRYSHSPPRKYTILEEIGPTQIHAKFKKTKVKSLKHGKIT
jgi:hypothetical protein